MQQNHSKMKAIFHKHQALVYVFHKVDKFVHIQHHMHQVLPAIVFLFKQKSLKNIEQVSFQHTQIEFIKNIMFIISQMRFFQ